MYKNIWGLTCIENHILALLHSDGMDERLLYCDSYISASELYEQVENKMSAFEYTGIERIQDICKSLGIIRLRKYVSDTFVKPNVNKKILLRVKPEFNKSVLCSRGYRTDHYVIVESNSYNSFRITNDIPEKHLMLDEQTVKNAYDGDYFEVEILRDFSNEDIRLLLERWYKQKDKYSEYRKVDIVNVVEYDNIRTLLLLLKILRKRSVAFCNVFALSHVLDRLLICYEEIFTNYEYYRIRGRIDEFFVSEIISSINNLEEEFFYNIKEVI